MSSIFISHSSSDNAMARDLERRLDRQGHSSVFLDLDPEKGIVGGQSWERTLYRKIRACRAVIALVTDDYVKSHWCFAEIALARMEGKFVFALKVDPLSPETRMPSILTEKQYIDLRSDPEDGYKRLWRGLRRVDVLGVKGEWDPKESPYLGFDSFQEKHAPLFFGREDEARAGVELLERGSPGLIMTLGPSGSGKSSLVRAAIIPRLRRLEDRWLVVEPFRPGRDPFAALAAALFDTFRRYAPDATKSIGNAERLAERLRAGRGEPLSQEDGERRRKSVDDAPLSDDERVQRLMLQLAEFKDSSAPADPDDPFVNFLDWTIEDLRKIAESPVRESRLTSSGGATALIDVANDLRTLSNRSDARVLVVVDQFEELLGEGAAASDAEIFLRFLRESFEDTDSPLVILGTMRSDFLGLFQRHPVMRGVDYEPLSLGPMSTEGMRRVIEEPAKLGAIELEPGLTDRLISDTETPDALPLLSFTLWVLWRDFGDDRLIQLSEYDELGGLHGAVVREAEALVTRGDKDALRRAFLAMVRLDDNGRFSRKAVAWDSPDLVPVHPLLEQFVARRLLVVRSDGDTRIVEVAHEALFRTWRLLRDWLDQGRSEVLLTQQIARDAIAWEESGHEKDALWRGTRLLQARELLKRNKLDGVEKEFVKKGVDRERLIKGSILGTAAAVFLGLGALTMYAFSAKQQATANELAAILAQEEMSDAYEEMVIRILPIVQPDNVVPGTIHVDKAVLEMSPMLQQAGFGESLAILGRFGDGRIMALAHDAFLASAPGGNELFVEFALRWLTLESGASNVYYSVGHCETVSESGTPQYRIAKHIIQDLGYSIDSLGHLTGLTGLNTDDTVLIVGNAWASFEPSELDAVGRFVDSGGQLLMLGLQWSWNDNKANEPGMFNPCTFNPFSTGREKDESVYPMNALGEQFGITYQPGYAIIRQ